MGWSRYLRRGHWDEERARELDGYLEHEIDDNLARGMSSADAEAAAHRKLGNVTRIREEIYEMNTLGLLDSIWQDLRYGARLLLRNRTFAVVAILTLALGTGANAAIFQVVNAVRLRTLPVESPDELVSIGIDRHGKGRVGIGYDGRSIHSEPLWQALRREQQAFSSVFAWGPDRWDLSTEGELRPADGLFVSGNFFEALGVGAQVGRVFGEADDQKGCSSPAAVISHGFWQARYGGRADAIGRTITLNRRPFTIVGVTPPPFYGVEVGRAFDVAIPLCAEPGMREYVGTGRADVWWLDIMGRLKPGWTVERAASHLATMSPAIFASLVPPRYNAEMARNYKANTFTAEPAATGVSRLRTQYAVPLWVLLGATGIVLLLACANLANLMLARASARDREIAVRLAIGASRRRIVRQMLSESLLLAALGAAGGFLLARWLSRALVLFLSTESDPLFVDLASDWRVFGFVALAALFACVFFGLAPALKATRGNPARTMQVNGRATTAGRHAFALRRGLVVVQLALSVVLIVGAMLFARSLRNLTTVDVGFRQDGLLAAHIDLRNTAVREDARREAQDEILRRLRAVPGVHQAAEALIVPMSGTEWNGRVAMGGQVRNGTVYFNLVGPDYFTAIDTPVLAGRTFGTGDRPDTPKAVVVNQAFARRYFPGAPPLGQTFQMEATPGTPVPLFHIVGLVENTKYLDIREESAAIVYMAMSQEAELPPYFDVLLRSDLPPGSLTPSLTRAISEVAPGAGVSYDTIKAYVRDSLVTERLMASLSGFFGVLALLVATIGLYGVVSYGVSQRRTEIGVRMALGAGPREVVRMVLAESGLLATAGLLAGTVLAMLSARYAATLLFDLRPWDPWSFAAAIGTLGLVCLVAAWIPARKASRLAPTMALRE